MRFFITRQLHTRQCVIINLIIQNMRLTKIEWILLLLLLGSMGFMIGLYNKIDNQNAKIAELSAVEEIEVSIPTDSIATPQEMSLADSIMMYLVECKVQHIDIAFAQIMLETGWLKSSIYRKGNNLFGMKFPSKRPTTATSIVYGHASYSHWKVSIHDYMLWQAYFGRNLTKQEYKKVLERRYAEDPLYISKLENIMKRGYKAVAPTT